MGRDDFSHSEWDKLVVFPSPQWLWDEERALRKAEAASAEKAPEAEASAEDFPEEYLPEDEFLGEGDFDNVGPDEEDFDEDDLDDIDLYEEDFIGDPYDTDYYDDEDAEFFDDSDIFGAVFDEEYDEDEDDPDEDGHPRRKRSEEERIFLGHRGRLRLRAIRDRLDGMKPQEILEFLLYYALPRQDVHQAARALMKHFRGDLRSVFAGSLEDYLKVPGLGEAGAQWMDLYSRLLRLGRAAEGAGNVRVANPAQLREHGRRLMHLYGAPSTLLLLTGEEDQLLLRLPMDRSARWGEVPLLGRTLDLASSIKASSAYILVCTDHIHSHPDAYDQKAVQDYITLLQHTHCTLRDVVFMDGEDSLSLRRMNLMPEDLKLLPRVSEEKLADLPGDELILRLCPAGKTPTIKRIPKCKLEEERENERIEPV